MTERLIRANIRADDMEIDVPRLSDAIIPHCPGCLAMAQVALFIGNLEEAITLTEQSVEVHEPEGMALNLTEMQADDILPTV